MILPVSPITRTSNLLLDRNYLKNNKKDVNKIKNTRVQGDKSYDKVSLLPNGVV